MFTLLNAIMGWIKKHNAKEVIVLDGFPDQVEPGSKRNALVFSSDLRAAGFTDSGVEPIEEHDNTSVTGHFTSFIEGISGGAFGNLFIKSGQVRRVVYTDIS